MRRAGQTVRELTWNPSGAGWRPMHAAAGDLEKAAEVPLKSLGAKAAFTGYHGYPCALCTSVNSEVVHGIPSPNGCLRTGRSFR